ncbi:MAG: hypothetical protein F6K14_04030 [Symploca sp. SIO2C1]|nr:hypothetical protein [Symploca sp. SIO2C1]
MYLFAQKPCTYSENKCRSALYGIAYTLIQQALTKLPEATLHNDEGAPPFCDRKPEKGDFKPEEGDCKPKKGDRKTEEGDCKKAPSLTR